MAIRQHAITENDVKNQVIDFLTLRGWLVLRVNSGAFAGEYTDKKGNTRKRFLRYVKWFCGGVLDNEGDAGVSDIIAVHPAFWPLAVETKRPGNEAGVTDDQRRFLDHWRKHGGIGIVASSVDDVINTLEGLGRG